MEKIGQVGNKTGRGHVGKKKNREERE